ncbi:sigma factor [Kribbella sp. CA-245084]|uniref:sigma factor n=1 Tax=Kribbella sp. CA-245084 TaxID=3239940 RepID=UPI003D90A8CA
MSIDDGVVTTGVTRVRADDGTGSFDAFVAARSQSLLRTAYLLTRDHALAEDLVQTALAKAWFHWARIREDNPEPYVRRILVTTYSSWWRRRWNGEIPTEELPESPAPHGEDQLDSGTRSAASRAANAPSLSCASTRTSAKPRPPA